MNVIVLNKISNSEVLRIVRIPSCTICYVPESSVETPNVLYLCSEKALPVVDKNGKAEKGILCLYVVGYMVHYHKYVVCDCITDTPFLYDKAGLLALCKQYKVYGVNIKGTEVALVDERQKIQTMPSTFDMTKFDKLYKTIRQKKDILSLTDTAMQPHVLKIFGDVYTENTADYFNAIFEYNKRCLGLPGLFTIPASTGVQAVHALNECYKREGNSLYALFKECCNKGIPITFDLGKLQSSGGCLIAFCGDNFHRMGASNIPSALFECCLLNYSNYPYSYGKNRTYLSKIHVVGEEKLNDLYYFSSLRQVPVALPCLPKAKQYDGWTGPLYGIRSETMIFDDDTVKIHSTDMGYCGVKALYIGKNVISVSKLRVLDKLPLLRYVVVRSPYVHSLDMLKYLVNTGVVLFCVRNSRFTDYIKYLCNKKQISVVEHGAESVDSVNAMLHNAADVAVSQLVYSPPTEELNLPTYVQLNGEKWKLVKGTLHVCYIQAETSEFETVDAHYNYAKLDVYAIGECLFNSFKQHEGLNSVRNRSKLYTYIGKEGKKIIDIMCAEFVKDFYITDEDTLFGALSTKEVLACFMSFFRLPSVSSVKLLGFAKSLWYGLYNGFLKAKGFMDRGVFEGMCLFLRGLMICYVLVRYKELEVQAFASFKADDIVDLREKRTTWYKALHAFLDKCPEVGGLFLRYPSKALRAQSIDMMTTGIKMLQRKEGKAVSKEVIDTCLEVNKAAYWGRRGKRLVCATVVANSNATEELEYYKKSNPTAEQIAKGLGALNLYINTDETMLSVAETEEYLGVKQAVIDKTQSLLGYRNKFYFLNLDDRYDRELFKSCGDFVWLQRYIASNSAYRGVCLKMIGYANPELYEHLLKLFNISDTLPKLLQKYKTADFWVYYNTGGLLFNTKPVMYYRYSKQNYREMQGITTLKDTTYFPVLESIAASENTTWDIFTGIRGLR